MSSLYFPYSNLTELQNCYDNFLIATWSSVIAFLCCLLGFPASLMVLQELLQRQRSSDLFMFNLTTSDLIFIAVSLFSIFNFFFFFSDAFHCIDNFLDGLSLCSRPLFMACICAECYFAVIHPVMYMTNKRSHSIRKIISLIIWLSTICFSIVKCFASETIIDSFNATPLFIALPVITFCDISVLRALTKTDPSGNTNIHPQKKQVFNIITISLIMTVFAYLPPVISFLIAGLGPDAIKCIAETSGYSVSMTGSVMMPIFYLYSVGKLNSLKEMWRRYIKTERQP